MIVSGPQHCDAAVHIHEPILPQTPLLSRLPHDIEQISLCETVYVLVGYVFTLLNLFFINVFLAALGVCCCGGYTVVVVCGLLTCCRAQALE